MKKLITFTLQLLILGLIVAGILWTVGALGELLTKLLPF